MVRMLRAGQTNFAYLSIPAGGPEEGFTPIWPAAGYDEKFLERWYYSLGPNDYSCVFQNDPDTKSARKISKLWFYDKGWFDNIETAPDHIKRFFARGTYVLSVDPAGTDARRSNKAGMTYCVHGPMEVLLPSGLIVEQHVLWFLKNWDMTASQYTISEIIADFYEQRRRPDGSHEVDKIIVETTGGFHATTEMLVNVKGVPDSVVSKRSPGRGNKIDRFLQYSALIEGGRVFFPGIYSQSLSGNDETELTMDPDWSEAANQMLRAGTVSDLNLLDCISQQLADVSHVFLEDNVLGHPDLIARQRAIDAKIRKDKKEMYERKLKGDTKNRRRRTPGASLGFLTQIKGKNWG